MSPAGPASRWIGAFVLMACLRLPAADLGPRLEGLRSAHGAIRLGPEAFAISTSRTLEGGAAGTFNGRPRVLSCRESGE